MSNLDPMRKVGTMDTETKPTVLCVSITVGAFIQITVPAALYPAVQMSSIIRVLEDLGNEPDVQYVWR